MCGLEEFENVTETYVVPPNLQAGIGEREIACRTETR